MHPKSLASVQLSGFVDLRRYRRGEGSHRLEPVDAQMDHYVAQSQERLGHRAQLLRAELQYTHGQANVAANDRGEILEIHYGPAQDGSQKIGRASCRARGESPVA